MTALIGADGSIFFTEQTRGSIARLGQDGVYYWKFATTKERGGFAGSWALFGGDIFGYTEKGFAICLDAATGKEKWARKFAQGSSAMDMSAATADGGSLLLPGKDDPGDEALAFNRAIFCLDTKTGKEKWKVKLMLGLVNCVPSIVDGLVAFTTINGEVACHSMADGAKKWMSKPSGQTSTGGAVICKETGLVYATVNLKGKKEFNKPKGGNGALRVYDLKTGEMKCEIKELLECNALPIVAPVGPEKRLLVIYGIGANPGTHKDPTGDEWHGCVHAVDAKTAESVWYSDVQATFWKGNGLGGTDGSDRYREQQGVAWSAPAATADGRVFIGHHTCQMLELDGATGEIKNILASKSCFHAGAAIGPDLLVVACRDYFYIYRNCQIKGDVVRELAVPLSESGVEHFWPHKMYNPEHTEFFELPATTDISRKPHWVAGDIDRSPYRVPGMDFYHKTPVIDSQRNVYVATNASRLIVIRPDGTIRGTVDCGPQLSNPCLYRQHLFVCNGAGFVVQVDIETLEVVRNVPYTHSTASDSWNPLVCDKQQILLTCGMLRWWVQGPVGGNLFIYGVRIADCSVAWFKQLPYISYNFLPSVYEEEDIFVFSDNSGGMYCWRISDGSEIWQDLTIPENLGAFTTGHCASGPNGVVYNAYNLTAGGLSVWNKGQAGGGIIQANVIRTGERKWRRKFEHECHVAPAVVPKPAGSDGGYLVVCAQGSQGGYGPPGDPDRKLEDDSSQWPSGDAWQNYVTALDGETGEELWRFVAPVWRHYEARGSYADDTFLPDCFGSPSGTAGGHAYIIHWSGIAYCLDAATGEVLSETDAMASSQSAVVFLPGTVLLPTAFTVRAIRDEKLEAEWLEKARAAGDKRADPRLLWGEGQKLTPADQRALNLASHVRPEVAVWPDTKYKPMSPPIPEYCEKTYNEKTRRLAKKLNLPLPPGIPEFDTLEDPLWEVVGGVKTGGIAVRKGEGLKSEDLGRLATGARIAQKGLKGERLHYSKVSGDGPDFGWVSLSFKGTELVKRV